MLKFLIKLFTSPIYIDKSTALVFFLLSKVLNNKIVETWGQLQPQPQKKQKKKNKK